MNKRGNRALKTVKLVCVCEDEIKIPELRPEYIEILKNILEEKSVKVDPFSECYGL
jgi:hypothetical protein